MVNGNPQPAGRPSIIPPMWDFCPKCMGITKHYYHITTKRYRCAEKSHRRRATIVTLLKYKTLANPLHPGYTEDTESD